MLDDAIGPIDPADPKGRKRRRILDAAVALFAEQGYRRTNVDEIARAAGVAKGTVYLYFKTKGDLVYSAIALEKKQHLERLRDAFDPRVPPQKRLHRMIAGALTMVADMPVTSRLLADPREIGAVMHDLPAGLMQQNEALGLEMWGELVEAAAPEKLRPQTLRERLGVLSVLGPLARHVNDPQTRGPLSARKFARVLADMLVSGLLRPEEEDTR
jgi:TetR/AcrR family fatty acid metabolism transcriptional regulator